MTDSADMPETKNGAPYKVAEVWLAPCGGIPTGNWKQHEKTRFIPADIADTLAAALEAKQRCSTSPVHPDEIRADKMAMEALELYRGRK